MTTDVGNLYRSTTSGALWGEDPARHRYALTRRYVPGPATQADLFAPRCPPARPLGVPGAPPTVFVMLNPSTADEVEDDPTVARCGGFARGWGAGGLIVVNLYALRSTDPRGLLEADDPIGPGNDAAIFDAVQLAADGGTVVAAWGSTIEAFAERKAYRERPAVASYRRRVAAVMQAAHVAGVRLVCLGVTSSGAPRHPLYLSRGAQRKPWAPAWVS